MKEILTGVDLFARKGEMEWVFKTVIAHRSRPGCVSTKGISMWKVKTKRLISSLLEHTTNWSNRTRIEDKRGRRLESHSHPRLTQGKVKERYESAGERTSGLASCHKKRAPMSEKSVSRIEDS